MIGIDTLNDLSKSIGIDATTILREIIQIDFLNYFYETNLKNTYFKGGTCLRLMYSSIRFSEDLDFSTTISKYEISKKLEMALKKLAKIYNSINYRELKTVTGFSYKLSCYTEVSRQPLTVKLDFSTRENVQDPKVGTIETKLPVYTTVVVSYISEKEILAEKIRAILNRTKGRDVFDLWYLLSRGVLWDENIISEKLNYYKEHFDKESLLLKIKEWDQKELDSDVRKFLPVKDRGIIPNLKEILLDKLSLNKTE